MNFQLINLNENGNIWLGYYTIEEAVLDLLKWRNDFPSISWSLQDKYGYVITSKQISDTLSSAKTIVRMSQIINY